MSIYTSSTDYYVYAYIKENGIPYYIGKGRKDRAVAIHNVEIPTDKSKILILESGLTENDALYLEKRLIRLFGRKDNETGILDNLKGSSDWQTYKEKKIKRKSTRSDSWKKQLSERMSGAGNHSWGKTAYELTSPSNEIFVIPAGISAWCKERNLSHGEY
jgi:hypothetical protein